MRKLKRICIPILTSGCIISMIVTGRSTAEAAYSGVLLCLQVVIPSLFPFIFICTYANSSIFGYRFKFLKPLSRLCRIPEGSESLLIMGLLGGYPIGAQCVAQSYSSGILSKNDAERMLGFCNNAGPAFIFGMLYSIFPEKNTLWLLWYIQIISCLLTACILPGGTKTKQCVKIQQSTLTFPQTMEKSFTAIKSICGWVVIFRILISVLQLVISNVPPQVTVIVSGFLELVNGCIGLNSIENIGLQFMLVSTFLGFGGLCVHMQTISVTQTLSKRAYISGKMIHTTISTVISFLVQLILYNSTDRFLPSVTSFFIFTVIFPITIAFFRKNSSISDRNDIQ